MRGLKAVLQGRHLLAAALFGLGIGTASQAFAQSANNPAATINGTVPTSEGNIWGGVAHQPTEAEVPQPPVQRQEQLNQQLQNLDQQLMNEPLPSLPQGSPSVPGNTSQ
jgi:hypothetical protein